MKFVISQPNIAAIPVEGTDAVFPVRRIWCVGRNFADHAREMGHDPDREPPFFFSKPSDAVVPNGGDLPFPVQTQDLHHEVELVVALGKGGTDISEETALEHVFGYGVGIDLTRRDIQAVAKKMQRPWELAKGFDQSCPVSSLVPASKIGHPDKGPIWLKINGEIRQEGDLNQQIWRVEETIAYLSRYVTLEAGDVILNGTPAGVGPILAGDTLHAHIDGVGDLTVHYVAR
jgi:fumarylpyruvate hydrolase